MWKLLSEVPMEAVVIGGLAVVAYGFYDTYKSLLTIFRGGRK